MSASWFPWSRLVVIKPLTHGQCRRSFLLPKLQFLKRLLKSIANGNWSRERRSLGSENARKKLRSLTLISFEILEMIRTSIFLILWVCRIEVNLFFICGFLLGIQAEFRNSRICAIFSWKTYWVQQEGFLIMLPYKNCENFLSSNNHKKTSKIFVFIVFAGQLRNSRHCQGYQRAGA